MQNSSPCSGLKVLTLKIIKIRTFFNRGNKRFAYLPPSNSISTARKTLESEIVSILPFFYLIPVPNLKFLLHVYNMSQACFIIRALKVLYPPSPWKTYFNGRKPRVKKTYSFLFSHHACPHPLSLWYLIKKRISLQVYPLSPPSSKS